MFYEPKKADQKKLKAWEWVLITFLCCPDLFLIPIVCLGIGAKFYRKFHAPEQTMQMIIFDIHRESYEIKGFADRSPSSLSLTSFTTQDIHCNQIPKLIRARKCRDLSARVGDGVSSPPFGTTPAYEFGN